MGPCLLAGQAFICLWAELPSEASGGLASAAWGRRGRTFALLRGAMRVMSRWGLAQAGLSLGIFSTFGAFP